MCGWYRCQDLVERANWQTSVRRTMIPVENTRPVLFISFFFSLFHFFLSYYVLVLIPPYAVNSMDVRDGLKGMLNCSAPSCIFVIFPTLSVQVSVFHT